MWLDVSFGAGKTGLATVGYRLYTNTGTDAQARTTTGVVEIGQGAYGVNDTSIPVTAVGVEWDTGEATPVYAHEDFGWRLLEAPAGIETSYDMKSCMRVMAASVCGKLDGAATTTVTMRDLNDTKDRITATVDANGNRTAVTLDAT